MQPPDSGNDSSFSSPSSNISYGWEEVTVNTHFVSEYSYSNQRRSNNYPDECVNLNGTDMSFESSDSEEVTESKDRRNLSNFGERTANKYGSNLREVMKGVDHSNLAKGPSLSEMLAKDSCRNMKTHNVSKSEHSENKSDDTNGMSKTFEDSEASDSNGTSGSEHPAQEEPSRTSALLNNEEYGTIEMECDLKLEDLTEEEEIWMVQCPISLNPQHLKDKEWVFGGKSDFTLQLGENLQRYETTSYVHRNNPVTCLLPIRKKDSLEAKMLQPVGSMVIAEKVEVPELKITLPKQSHFKIPKGLRVRHPLFGPDYEQELELRKQVTSQHCTKVQEDLCSKREKNDKHVKSYSIWESTDARDGSSTLQTHDERHHKKKKDKQKKYDNEECKKKRKRKADEDFFEESKTDTKRKKDNHEKIQTLDISSYENETFITDSQSYSTAERASEMMNIGKVRIEEMSNCESEGNSKESTTVHIKNKKKRQRAENLMNSGNELFTSNVATEHKKKSKKKLSEETNETCIIPYKQICNTDEKLDMRKHPDDSVSTLEERAQGNDKKKIKKKKKHKDVTSDETTVTYPVSYCEPKVLKKKHKKEERV